MLIYSKITRESSLEKIVSTIGDVDFFMEEVEWILNNAKESDEEGCVHGPLKAIKWARSMTYPNKCWEKILAWKLSGKEFPKGIRNGERTLKTDEPRIDTIYKAGCLGDMESIKILQEAVRSKKWILKEVVNGQGDFHGWQIDRWMDDVIYTLDVKEQEKRKREEEEYKRNFEVQGNGDLKDWLE